MSVAHRAPLKYTGIPASPGIGVGPVFVVVAEEYKVREFPIAPDRVDAEIAFFAGAIDASRRDLAQIRNGIAAELGEHEAAIYDAQMMMLDDPDLHRVVEGEIRNRRNAGIAFRDYMAAVAARLERVEDEYLRERRADVMDVERRVLRHLMGDSRRGLTTLTQPSILIAHELGPSDVALLDRERVLGMVTEVGGRTSHGAIVARGRGIPAVVAVRGILQAATAGMLGIVDGFLGHVELEPEAETASRYRKRRSRIEKGTLDLRALIEQPAVTPDGKKVELAANIELPQEVESAVAAGADGVGLFRTEFFYLDRAELPSEEEQVRAYRMVAERLAPRPVIFRTMDLGGDKVASYLGTTHETNPFLGYRGIRFALSHPEVFRTQIRAIYRASAHGKARMMFPMVSSVEELRAALAMCRQVADDLARENQPFDRDLEIGIMIETPSAVWVADLLARESKFLSIGSNDLIQYTLAMDRDNERLAYLYEPLGPAVLRSLRHTVEAGHAAGRWVGVCGEMAGDARHAVLLVGLGVDELSVSCFDLPRVKAAIRSVPASTAIAIANEALACECAEAVRALLHRELDPLLPEFLVGDGSGS
ncbi:MAG: phosphoenolpyruvate--protein phosphotransferase [Candidatus Eisenbacteria bacterium]|uniref:Phosphoenolpyruvate-protein phosphotransferase n=1 Tax=Eiseniibacteriota bacterium TaxID=2212470 RepID=A0A9D6L660_UNCEI|nr:phosphoenolpyruvate--protein phosphotransferase [Candidatus Eisenbacteria bacterium]MBI3539341.1 phosphoenolpyruvate--protein phosphotransferase [Candidatus Eisenbacteria bacterium]